MLPLGIIEKSSSWKYIDANECTRVGLESTEQVGIDPRKSRSQHRIILLSILAKIWTEKLIHASPATGYWVR